MDGFPIWYELMSADPGASADFYCETLGWSVPASGDVLPNGSEYAMIMRADGGMAGGVLKLSQAMLDGGAHPGWLTYFNVEDVDATVEAATRLGANVHMEATTMPGVGRMAMLADPEGAPFYVMDPIPPEGGVGPDDGVFKPALAGRCAWNELATSEAPAQIEFYTSLFDWQVAGEMPMPGDHIYKFMVLGETGVGAIGSMKPEGSPNAWLPYFRVEDIDEAIAAVKSTGGTVLHGPHAVPNEDHIIAALDPAGAALGIVGKKAG